MIKDLNVKINYRFGEGKRLLWEIYELCIFLEKLYMYLFIYLFICYLVIYLIVCDFMKENY